MFQSRYKLEKDNNISSIKELSFVVGILIISFISIYIIPILSHLVFLFFLILVLRSNKDYLWLSIVLILANYPGGIFSGKAADDHLRIPIYVLASGFSFSFFDLYFLVLLLKSIIKRQLFKIYFHKYFQIILIYLTFLLLISFIMGMNFSSISATYKTFIKLSVFFSIHFVFRKYQHITNFFKIIFPFAIIALLLQLYDITQGQQLVALFKPGVTVIQGILTGDEIRPIEMDSILLICFVGSLFYMTKLKPEFNKNYLLIINLITFIAVIMTATRTWFVAFLACYFYFVLFNVNQARKYSIAAVAGFLIFIFVNIAIPEINNQIDTAWSRIATIQLLAKGDVTAGGTLIRITERLPRVMEGFRNSTILFGAGFSNLFYDYSDPHVTYANILLNAGIVGFIIVYWFIFKIFITLKILVTKTHDVEMKILLKNVFLGFVAILVLSTSTAFYGFTNLNDARIITLSFIFSWVNIIIIESLTNRISNKTIDSKELEYNLEK